MAGSTETAQLRSLSASACAPSEVKSRSQVPPNPQPQPVVDASPVAVLLGKVDPLRPRPELPGDRVKSVGRSGAEPPHVPHERKRSAEEGHGSSHEPEDRRPGAELTKAGDDQHHAGKDAEHRDQSADAVSHMYIINGNLSQRK